MGERAFSFLRINERPPKPRKTGLTEIRGPYYTLLGKRHLEDILETMTAYIDSLKFAGGSFTLIPRPVRIDLLKLCHDHDVFVSTGGFLEYVLTQGTQAFDKYIQERTSGGFDIIHISCGLITIPADKWLRPINRVIKAGRKAKQEAGIQFGAGGRPVLRIWKPPAHVTRSGQFSLRRGFSMPARTGS